MLLLKAAEFGNSAEQVIYGTQRHEDTKFYYTQKSTQILQKYLCQIFEDFCPLFLCAFVFNYKRL